MKLFSMLLIMLSLVACNKEYDGSFEVFKDVDLAVGKIKKKKPRPIITVAQGTYRGVEFKASSKSSIKIKIPGLNDDKFIKLVIGKDSIKALKNYDFNLSSTQISQDFGVTGSRDTNYQDGPIINSSETCSYTIYRTVCRRVCRINQYGQQVCRRICRQQPVTHWGHRDVSYYTRTTSHEVKLNFIDEVLDEKIAEFNGVDYDYDKFYTYQSRCF